MKRKAPLALRVFGRLGFGLVLLLGLCLALGMQTRPAHAQGLVVTDCTGENGPGQIGTILSSASSGDTITFSCSGDIPLTSTLTINTNNLTIDGSGQSITLDGQNNVQVLVVGSGITFTLNNLTVAHGSSSCCNGGGLFNDGTVTISNSTFANNSAADGGGLGNNGTMTINNSTFASNTGGEGGGLITTGTLTVSNSTFTNNSATDGGGINSQGGTATISNSTFSGNSVSSVGGRGGGIGNIGSGTVNVEGSIVANNSGNNCFGVSDQGYNLESSTDCGFTGTGDLQNANPLLSALASNGGPTQTMALQQGSPAIDQVPLANCPSTDQRGDTRPDAATPTETTCDMGAYESDYTAPLNITDCSSDSQLQAAVTQANTDNNGDTITFSCSGDIKLTSTLTINGSMSIDGSGQSVTLDGNNQVQALQVNSGVTFNLKNITVANALKSANDATGGGLYNDFGTVNITNSTFTGNSAPNNGYGGAIYNGGTMTITSSTLTNNSASYGAALLNSGTVTITNSTLTANTAAYNGGGIWTNSTVNLVSSTIATNKATAGYGGGIYNGGTVNAIGSIVAENTAATGNDCSGTVTDNGYNIDSDSSCFTASTSKHANPQLSALANNGGPTETMALQQGSPAIDQVPLASCPSTDQRGNVRPDAATPAETTCDMGAYESSYTASLTVNGTSVSATEGAAFKGKVASGSYSGSGTLSASINWGDGTTATTGTVSLNAGSFSVTGSHTYAEEGSYTVVVSVNDGQGLSGSANSSATVKDAALTLKQFSASETSHLTEKVTALFTDADPAGTVSDYTATITWGDGKSSSATITKGSSGFTATASHLYAKTGTYSVKLTVTDKGGSKLTKTVSVTVK